MHELAITESVIDAVSLRVDDGRVTRVVLEIGKLSGVVPDAVRFCFDVCAAGTVLESAVLDIVEIAGQARCRTCQAELALTDCIALCTCGSADLDVLSGQQLTIKEVEVT